MRIIVISAALRLLGTAGLLRCVRRLLLVTAGVILASVAVASEAEPLCDSPSAKPHLVLRLETDSIIIELFERAAPKPSCGRSSLYSVIQSPHNPTTRNRCVDDDIQHLAHAFIEYVQSPSVQSSIYHLTSGLV